MSAKLYPVFAALKPKTSRKLGFCDIFVNEIDSHQTLFFVIEINSPTPNAKNIANLIVNTVEEEYQKHSEKPTDEAFELALKKVNESLEELVRDGEVSWLGKLNASIALLKNKSFIFSVTGKGEVYLLREDHFVKISEGLYTSSEKPNPLKTFMNISFGHINEDDILLFTTPEIFNYISPHKLKKTLLTHLPPQAAKTIAAEFDDEEVITPCSLIVAIKNEEKMPGYTPLPSDLPEKEASNIQNEESFAIFLKTQILPFAINFYKRIFALTKKVFLLLGSGIIIGIKFFIKIIKEAYSFVQKFLSEYFQKKKTKKYSSPPTNEKEEEVKFETQIPTQKPRFSQNFLKIRFPEVPFLRKITSFVKKNLLPYLVEAWENLKELIKDLRSLKLSDFKNLKNYKNRSDKYYLAMFTLTLILFVGAIGFTVIKQKMTAKTKENENLLAQAEMMIVKAESALISDDEVGRKEAQEILSTLSSLLEKLEKENYKKDKVEEIKQRVEKAYEKINKIFRIAPQSLYNFADLQGQNTGGLILHNNNLCLFDKEKAQIFTFNPNTKSSEKIFEKTEESGIIAIHSFQDTLTVLKDNKLYEFNEKLKTLIPVTLLYDSEIKPAIDIDSYKNYLYILSPQENQIFRAAKTLGGLNRFYPYIKESVDIKNAIDFVIGDYVYVLKENGEILKFSSGYPINFTIKNLPSTLLNPALIYTSSKLSQIYVLDKGQSSIIVLDKKGNYLKQYKSDLFAKTTGLYVSEEDNKVYFITENILYMFEE